MVMTLLTADLILKVSRLFDTKEVQMAMKGKLKMSARRRLAVPSRNLSCLHDPRLRHQRLPHPVLHIQSSTSTGLVRHHRAVRTHRSLTLQVW